MVPSTRSDGYSHVAVVSGCLAPSVILDVKAVYIQIVHLPTLCHFHVYSYICYMLFLKIIPFFAFHSSSRAMSPHISIYTINYTHLDYRFFGHSSRDKRESQLEIDCA